VNFALILFCLVAVSGAVWLADVMVFKRSRQAQRDRILAHAREEARPETGLPGAGHAVSEDEIQHMTRDTGPADARDRCGFSIRMVRSLLVKYGKKLSDGERTRIAAAIEESEKALRGGDLELIRRKSAALDVTTQMFFKDPWWVEYGASFFPVILVVFLLRSFVVEPFKIPSGSMIPTLQVGDFILVNKFAYGIRLPLIDRKIIEIGAPRRGDVMVFRYPEDPSLDYIKRVIGVPGDRVAWQNKQLAINGKPVEKRRIDDYLHPERLFYSRQFAEKIDETEYRALNDQDAPVFTSGVSQFPHRENCLYNSSGVICTVPEGHYFMMGDNRDNSTDSRYWGFVPDENIVGKAFLIWLNFSDWSRPGSSIK
jgi:signal peptidase I